MPRFFDLVISTLALVLLLPIIVVAWLTVRVVSGPPAIFRQVRVGRGHRPFTLLKFRSMAIRAVEKEGFEAGSTQHITPIGVVMRRSKIDELPQIFNVLRGDMAIVGPRPEVREWVERCPEQFNVTLRVRPGLTDPASIVFRNEQVLLAGFDDPEGAYQNLVLPAKLELSTQYLNSRTLRSDLVVLWATFCAIVGLPHPWSHIDASALLQARRDRLDAEGRR
ncbi:MAG TPA: sugar transferase [Phycisphaerales bacterium]|jgi:lipopolysaccharide/colanic/teichoic acid biosynthesis glycosyltransferase|nr:sugar transferase [Phycisphaerales bacterium]